MWPLVLMPWGGHHPQDEAGFKLLQDNQRTQGHITEMGHANPSIPSHHAEGEYVGQSFLGEGSHDDDEQYAYPQTACDDDGWDFCVHCDGYFDYDDDGNDTDTDDESTTDMSQRDLDHYLGHEPLPSVEEARSQYVLAKRRFRSVSGKAPRHFRRPRRFKGGGTGRSKGKGKGKGKKSRGWPPSVFKGHSPLSSRSLAGGKGKRRWPKGKSPRRRWKADALTQLQQRRAFDRPMPQTRLRPASHDGSRRREGHTSAGVSPSRVATHA